MISAMSSALIEVVSYICSTADLVSPWVMCSGSFGVDRAGLDHEHADVGQKLLAQRL